MITKRFCNQISDYEKRKLDESLILFELNARQSKKAQRRSDLSSIKDDVLLVASVFKNLEEKNKLLKAQDTHEQQNINVELGVQLMTNVKARDDMRKYFILAKKFKLSYLDFYKENELSIKNLVEFFSNYLYEKQLNKDLQNQLGLKLQRYEPLSSLPLRRLKELDAIKDKIKNLQNLAKQLNLVSDLYELIRDSIYSIDSVNREFIDRYLKEIDDIQDLADEILNLDIDNLILNSLNSKLLLHDDHENDLDNAAERMNRLIDKKNNIKDKKNLMSAYKNQTEFNKSVADLAGQYDSKLKTLTKLNLLAGLFGLI